MGFRACGAPHFLLLRQKKVRKEKATRRQRPAAQGSLRYSVFAGAAELGPTGLRQSSRYFREALRCSALLTGRENRRTPKLLTLNNVWKSEPLVVP